MHDFYEIINRILGLEKSPAELTFGQIALRAFIVFITTLVMVRLGDRRFLSKKTVFDVILGFILASMLARAVNGTTAFFSTLGSGFVLVGLHRVMAHIARHSHWFGALVKGNSDLVIKDGEVQTEALRRNDLSELDLMEGLRLNGHVDDPKEVKTAFFERNGDISVVKKGD